MYVVRLVRISTKVECTKKKYNVTISVIQVLARVFILKGNEHAFPLFEYSRGNGYSELAPNHLILLCELSYYNCSPYQTSRESTNANVENNIYLALYVQGLLSRDDSTVERSKICDHKWLM